DVVGADDFAEAVVVALHQGGKLLGVQGVGPHFLGLEFFDHGGNLEHFADLGGEFVDDVLRGALGGEDAVPHVHFVVGHAGFLECGDIRQGGAALVAGDGQRLDAAGLDVGQEGADDVHANVDFASGQGGEQVDGAGVGDAGELGAGL